MDGYAKGSKMKDREIKVIAKIIRGVAKVFSRYPFVEVLSLHLGHTLIESASLMAKKPVAIIWKKPEANKWLVKKVKENLRFPKIDNWINRNINKKNNLGEILRNLFRGMSDQYWLLNLGFNHMPFSLTISFTEQEELDAKKFMNDHKIIENQYVCFCIRDESYYQNYKSDLDKMSSGTRFVFRNADIRNYIECAKELLKREIQPVIMGFSKNEHLYSDEVKSVFLRPYKDPAFRPWIEAYLFKKCAFCIGMMTGGTLYAKNFNRPVLWTDIFWRGSPVGSKCDMIVPKRISYRPPNKKSNPQLLSLEEMRKLGPPPNNDWSYFEKKGYKVLNSTSDELLNAMLDMLAYLKTGKYFHSSEDRLNHKAFSSLHFPIIKRKLITPTRLAPSWAHKYHELLSDISQRPYKIYWSGRPIEFGDVEEMFLQKRTKVLFGKSRR